MTINSSRVSCNDIKVHGNHKGMKDFKDGLYFIKSSKTNQLPVYCDMTSNSSAWTLLVTSKQNNWTAQQVLILFFSYEGNESGGVGNNF